MTATDPSQTFDISFGARSRPLLDYKPLLIVLLFSLAGGTAIGAEVESDIDRLGGPTYRIVLFPLPERLKPSDAMAGRHGQLTDRFSPYIPVPTTTDQLRELYRLNLYRVYPSKPIGPWFNVESDIVKLIDQIDAASNWSISEVVEYPFYDDSSHLDMRRIQAEDELSKTTASGVIYLEFVFMLGRQLDQLRVIVKVGVYERRPHPRRPSKTLSVTYEYFSPSRGAILRPWHEGEKEKIIASIDARYDEKLARWPHNRKAYRKDRRSELSAIKKRDVVFEETAIEEGWPTETVIGVLRDAIDHLTPLIISDLGTLELSQPKNKSPVSFEYINWRGNNVTLTGTVIGRTDGQVVYQDRKGNVFSMPAE